jgi:hypothetical protein
MAEADIREEVIARPATVDRAARQATRVRVTEVVVAPGQHLAAAEDMHPVVEAAAIPVVAATPVVVADIQAITKPADRTLT